MNETTVILVEVGGMLLGLSLLGRLSMRFGISPIPLYLLAGLVLGTGGALEMSASKDFFEVGAEIGVILLLAMLGLEYSAEELVGSIKRSRISGMLDAVFNALPGAAFALLLGWGPIAAIALAGITWVSSSRRSSWCSFRAPLRTITAGRNRSSPRWTDSTPSWRPERASSWSAPRDSLMPLAAAQSSSEPTDP